MRKGKIVKKLLEDINIAKLVEGDQKYQGIIDAAAAEYARQERINSCRAAGRGKIIPFPVA